MSRMTKEELLNLNSRMLGQGAPVVIDGTGYSKVDYPKTAGLAGRSSISDGEAYMLTLVLIKYTNTQLISMKDSLIETRDYYKKSVKTVKVSEFDNNTVTLSWNYSKSVAEFIKNDFDRSNYKWTRDNNGNWLLKVKFAGIGDLLEMFQKHDFLVDEVQKAQETAETTEIKPATITLEVVRPEKSIDTLQVKFEYNDALVAIMKSIPNAWWNPSEKAWEIYIENSNDLYEKVSTLDYVDCTQLQTWSDMVKGWNKTYKMIDLSQRPLKFKPYDFQIEDIQTLLQKRVGLNGNDMGAGKTFEQIVIAESIPEKKLVICPPTLRLNWKKEILHVNPQADVNIIYSANQFTVSKDWNIIGYSSLDKFLKELEAEKFQVVMIDEAHYIQAISNAGTPDSARAFAVLRLAATAGFVYPITGTPKTNRNKNLFNILRVIRHPLTRGKWAFSNYGRTFCDGQNNGWGWDYNGNSNDDELNAQLKPYMVRHLKSEVLPDLKKQRIATPVEVDLREYHREIMEYLKNRNSNEAEDLARLMRARKILATQKVGESIDFAKDLIAQDKKVVIVTCFTDVVKTVENTFKSNCVKLVGGMSDTAKNKAIEDFQTGKPQVMVMNIVAGGVGVTLTASYNMIINDMDWTPGNLLQAEDRICRGGQTRCCNIYYMYADGADMDEVFVDTLTAKFDTINNAIDGGNGEAIDYIELINKALEKSTGVKKTRRIVKAGEVTPIPEVKVAASKVPEKPVERKPIEQYDYKHMIISELEELAEKVGAKCKKYDNPSIYRMRLTMAIKKQIEV